MNSSSWEELINESESNMKKLAADKKYSFSIYRKMEAHIDSCLKEKNYASILTLSPYFESPNSYPQLHHSGETRRIYHLIRFLRLELKYHQTPFVSSTTSYQSFTEQYILTVFAMRRLELSLSEDSVTEAITYLTSIPLSTYSALIIVENEYFENYQKLYWNLYLCMDELWSIPNKIKWLDYLTKKVKSPKILLEIASLCLKISDYSNAYSYMVQIPSPTPEIQSLIFSLKELLSHE